MARIFLDYVIEGDIWIGYRRWAIYFNDVTKGVEADFFAPWNIGEPSFITYQYGELMYSQCFGPDLYQVYKQQAQPFGNVVVQANAPSCLLTTRNSTQAFTDTAGALGALAADVCGFTNALQIYWNGPLEIGTALELEDTTPLPYSGSGWFRIGLDAYQINASSEVITIQAAECTVVPDPDPLPDLPEPEAGLTLHLPLASSIRFVQDGNTAIPTDENRLLKDQRYPGIINKPFWQTVKRGETLVIQWGSSYATNNLKVYSANGTLVSTIPGVKVQENLNQLLEIPGFALSSPEGDGVQLYFPSYPFPEFGVSGGQVNVDSTPIRGQFDIVKIMPGKGVALGNRAIVLNSALPIPNPVAVTVSGRYNVLPYDFYEAELTINTSGDYYMVIEAVTGSDEARATSEPIRVTEDLDDFVELAYTNGNDDFGAYYGNGIIHRRWVKGRIFQAFPGGEKLTNRETTAKLVKLDEFVTKSYLFEAFGLPPYLVMQISIALSHELPFIEGIAVQSEEQPEVEYTLPSPFANLSVRIEQVDYTQRNNILGDIDSTDSFLLINQGGRLLIDS